jgi:hypothetical protein
MPVNHFRSVPLLATILITAVLHTASSVRRCTHPGPLLLLLLLQAATVAALQVAGRANDAGRAMHGADSHAPTSSCACNAMQHVELSRQLRVEQYRSPFNGRPLLLFLLCVGG